MKNKAVPSQKTRNFFPRWLIFLLDMGLCSFCIYLAYLLRFNFQFRTLDLYKVNRVVEINAAICIFLFLFLKPYAGIIRYTGLQDAYKVLATTFCNMLLLWIITYGVVNFRQEGIFLPNSIPVIYFFCVTVLLTGYRLLAKELYGTLYNKRQPGENTLIFAAGEKGMLAYRAIANDKKSPFTIVGFLDDDPGKVGKMMDGLPIYAANKQPEILFRKLNICCVIIALQEIDSKRINEMVDTCLKADVKALSMPPVSSWLKEGRLSASQISQVKIEDLLGREPIKIKNEKVERQLNGKYILITGAAGSIGGEIARQVVHYRPAGIIINDQAESPLYELELFLKEAYPGLEVRSFIGSVRDRKRMEELFKCTRVDIIYHAAAYKHVPVMECHPGEAVLNNIMGTGIMAELAVSYGVSSFVMISTDKAVNPTNVMGASKRIAEIYIQSYNNHLRTMENGSRQGRKGVTRFITTRFGNVLGSNGSVIPRFKAQIARGGPITVTHPDITRYFMTIPEACRLVLEAGTMGKGGEVFVFDMGEPVKIITLAEKMIRLSGLIPNRDIKVVYTGLRPGEKLYEELLTSLETTLPTYHPKIKIAKVATYDFGQVKLTTDELIRNVNNGANDQEVVSLMKRIVPEYKSNNSPFERLDRTALLTAEVK